jgi:hypothetical protein
MLYQAAVYMQSEKLAYIDTRASTNKLVMAAVTCLVATSKGPWQTEVAFNHDAFVHI